MTEFRMPDSFYEPPNTPELLDESNTACLGHYPETDEDDAWDCESRSVCSMCGGVVCVEHDDTDDCDDGPVHEACHKDGCWSAACEADRHDDYLLAQAGM